MLSTAENRLLFGSIRAAHHGVANANFRRANLTQKPTQIRRRVHHVGGPNHREPRKRRESDSRQANQLEHCLPTVALAEPAGAAALAAVLGPLRPQLRGGQRIGIVVCGANIDLAMFFRHADAAP